MNTLKPTYRLLIDGKKFTLFSYEITHSVFTPASYAKVLTEKGTFSENTPLELYLGYDSENTLVFKGYVEEVYTQGEKSLILARNYHKIFSEQRVKGCLKDVTPKEVLEFLKPKGLVFEERPFSQKHHFLIWNYTKDYTIKKVLRTWNIKDYLYFFDLEEKLHLHTLGKFKLSKVKPPENFLLKFESQKVILKLFPKVFVNQEIELKNKIFIVKNLIHKNGTTLLEF